MEENEPMPDLGFIRRNANDGTINMVATEEAFMRAVERHAAIESTAYDATCDAVNRIFAVDYDYKETLEKRLKKIERKRKKS